MKAKLFIFGTDPSENRLFDFMIANTFNDVTDADGILYFPTVRDATQRIGEAFRSVDAVLFFAAKESYAEVKHVLCKALGLKLRVEPDLLQRATFSGAVPAGDNAAAVCHAGVPEKSEIFALSDGRYAGFGVRRGRQTVAVLPVELFRTGTVLADQVIPYLNEQYETDIPTDYAAHIFAFSLEEKLHDTDLTVSVSDTKTAALFRRYISTAGRLQDHMPIAAKAEQRGSLPPDEYVVNLSLTAAEFFHAPYGIAMSNAYYTGEDANSEKKVYLAITGPEENTVREITSFYGETTADFLQRCCGEMCILVEQVIEEDALAEIPEPEEPETPGKKKFHLIFSVMLALLAAIVAFGVYYFIEHDYTVSDWINTYLPQFSSYFADKNAVTQDPSARTVEAANLIGDGETTSDEASATTEQESESETTEEATTERPANMTASPTMPAYYFTTTTEPATEAEPSSEEAPETEATQQAEEPQSEQAESPVETPAEESENAG